MQDLPLAVLTATLCCYWIGVGVMIVRVRRKLRRSAAGEQRFERFNLMWLVWLALVAAWVGVPWATLQHSTKVPPLPDFATRETAYLALRWIAAIVAVTSLAATVQCWRRMGSNWRMDVGVATKAPLITDSLFAHIRHPIYAFQMLLMLCTLAIVPTLPMLVVAAIHIAVMNAKARSEERHLLAVHGDAYARYIRASGRFIPRLRHRQG